MVKYAKDILHMNEQMAQAKNILLRKLFPQLSSIIVPKESTK